MMRGFKGEKKDQTFTGFSAKAFDACETKTSKIKIACNELELFRVYVESEIQELDTKLHGIVSRSTVRRTTIQSKDHFQSWAWLMFTHAKIGKSGRPFEASDLTQLTINMSRDYLYVGFCLRTRADCRRLRDNFDDESNSKVSDAIVTSLGSREWVLTTTEQDFSKEEPRYYDGKDLKAFLRDPQAHWINARLDRDYVVGRKRGIVREVLDVFRQLYNVYAMSLDLVLIPQNTARTKPWEMPVVDDQETAHAETDEEMMSSAERIFSKLGEGVPPKHVRTEGKKDTYEVNRTVLPLSLTLHKKIDSDERTRSYYLDSGFTEKDFGGKVSEYDQLRGILDSISSALHIKPSAFQIMMTNGVTDARYLRDGKYIAANLVRYSTTKSKFFWLVTVAREIAYSFAGRLSYAHQNLMRKAIVIALSKWEDNKQ